MGNSVTLSASTPTIAVPHELYWLNNDGNAHAVTLDAQAPTVPSGWTVQVCADVTNQNGSAPPTTPSAASTGYNCSLTHSVTTCSNTYGWMSIGADQPAASTYSAQFCMRSGSGRKRGLVYWTVYTAPATVTSFQRYDATIAAFDDNSPPAFNATHDELYAGDVALTKSVAVVSNGCPAGVSPSYSALGVCPGGILRYTIDYRNIVAGAAMGTQGVASAASVYKYALTKAGSLVLTDDGTLSGVSQTATPNWSTFTLGLKSALSAEASNGSCGSGANACGDTTANTTFGYDGAHPSGVNATNFTATIGGAAFVLYPNGFPGKTGQGTITFAVTVK